MNIDTHRKEDRRQQTATAWFGGMQPQVGRPCSFWQGGSHRSGGTTSWGGASCGWGLALSTELWFSPSTGADMHPRETDWETNVVCGVGGHAEGQGSIRSDSREGGHGDRPLPAHRDEVVGGKRQAPWSRLGSLACGGSSAQDHKQLGRVRARGCGAGVFTLKAQCWCQ